MRIGIWFEFRYAYDVAKQNNFFHLISECLSFSFTGLSSVSSEDKFEQSISDETMIGAAETACPKVVDSSSASRSVAKKRAAATVVTSEVDGIESTSTNRMKSFTQKPSMYAVTCIDNSLKLKLLWLLKQWNTDLGLFYYDFGDFMKLQYPPVHWYLAMMPSFILIVFMYSTHTVSVLINFIR